MSDEPIKYMDVAEFQRLGFLQEANRQFFHQHGLALEMRGGWSREQVAGALAKAGYRYGADAVDNCMAIVHVLGLDGPHLSGVWDYREDPEGMGFVIETEEKRDQMRTKRDTVGAEQERHREARLRRFAGVVQPLEVWTNRSDRTRVDPNP